MISMLAPAAPLARVMRVVDPSQSQPPLSSSSHQAASSSQTPPGYSQGDYEEDVRDSTNEQEQDDDEGWGVVPVKKRSE